MTIATLWQDFLAIHLARFSHNYRLLTASIVRRHLLPTFGDRDPETLTRLEISRWHAETGQRDGQNIANRGLTILKSIYNFAIEMEQLRKNPCRGIPAFKLHPRKRFVQPGDEMQRLMVAIGKEPEREQCYLLLLLFTGARKMEACRVRWADIDFSTGIWQKPVTKTTHHSVIIPTPLLERLQRLPRFGEYVFMVRTGRHWYPSKAHFLFTRVRARAGLEDVHLHDLRRTCLVDLVSHGENLETVRRVANHATLKTTSVYLEGLTPELTRNPLEKRAARLGAYLSSNVTVSSNLEGQA